MSDLKDLVVPVEAVAQGAKFCDCGGMYVLEFSGQVLMSNPPQVKIICQFCGNTDTSLAPYNVVIGFRRKAALQEGEG